MIEANSVSRKKWYRAYGLTISSVIELPELTAIPLVEGSCSQSDVDIVLDDGELKLLWSQLAGPEDYFYADHRFILFRVTDFAIYGIEGGSRIRVSPLKETEEGELHAYIVGSCMAAILLQRRLMPLHASTVAIHGKAYAFVGRSGAGKSTLASACIAHGFQILSDDVTAICLNEQVPYVIPSFPSQKLWCDSLEKLGMDAHYQPLFHSGSRTKYSIPVSDSYSSTVTPLAGIFEIIPADQESVELKEQSGLNKIQSLFQHTFRKLFIKPMGMAEWHFMASMSMIKQVPIYRMKRPIHDGKVDEAVSTIMGKMNIQPYT